MAETKREILSGKPLTREMIEDQAAQGWRPLAIEWERIPESERAAHSGGAAWQEVPYGLRVAPDHQHLEEDPAELRVLLAILEGIVEDRRLSAISTELNRRGMRTRSGEEWTQTAVFQMLPRLIESSPRLFQHSAWVNRPRPVGAGAAER